MGTDAAMLVWLDTNTSTKAAPNENYAREVMELFSLGIGNYTEADIREAARAFTGYEIKDGKGVLNPRQHDASVKTVFGKKGKFTGEDVAKLCLDRPRARGSLPGSCTASSSPTPTRPRRS